MHLLRLCLLTTVLLVPSLATAAPLFKVATGAGVPNGAVDPHFTLVSWPDVAVYGHQLVVTPGIATPVRGSKPLSPPNGGVDVGTYVYRTTYTSHFAADTNVLLTGQFSADDEVTFCVNGVATASVGYSDGVYAVNDVITIPAGAQTTYFDFVVTNHEGTSGLSVASFTGTIVPYPPATPYLYQGGDLTLASSWTRGGVPATVAPGLNDSAEINSGTFTVPATSLSIGHLTVNVPYTAPADADLVLATMGDVTFTKFFLLATNRNFAVKGGGSVEITGPLALKNGAIEVEDGSVLNLSSLTRYIAPASRGDVNWSASNGGQLLLPTCRP